MIVRSIIPMKKGKRSSLHEFDNKGKQVKLVTIKKRKPILLSVKINYKIVSNQRS